MDLNNKRVLVVGLGKSGVASALFLKARGARVTVSDAKPQGELKAEIPTLLEHGIAVETGVGVAAVDAVREQQFGILIGVQAGKPSRTALEGVAGRSKPADLELLKLAQTLSL